MVKSMVMDTSADQVNKTNDDFYSKLSNADTDLNNTGSNLPQFGGKNNFNRQTPEQLMDSSAQRSSQSPAAGLTLGMALLERNTINTSLLENGRNDIDILANQQEILTFANKQRNLTLSPESPDKGGRQSTQKVRDFTEKYLDSEETKQDNAAVFTGQLALSHDQTLIWALRKELTAKAKQVAELKV